jgi:PST family polysaccharide transporter
VLLERELRFGPLAAAEIAQALVYYGTSIALALAGAGVWSFVVGAVAQSATGAVWLNVASGEWPGVALDRAIVRRLAGFGVDFQLSLFVTWLRDAMVPFLGGLLASAATVGYLNFAWRIAQLVNSAEEIVGRIAFPAFSRLQDDRPRLQEALEQATLSTTFIVAPLQCWVAATAGLLVPVAFGPQWTPAIAVVQLVCLGTLARYPSRYLRQALFAIGRSRAGLGLAVASLLVHVATFVPGLAIGGVVGAALAYVVATALTLTFFEVSLRGQLTAVSRRYLVLLVAGLIAGLAAAFVVAWQPNPLGLGASALAAAAVYLALIARAEPDAMASGRHLLDAIRSGAGWTPLPGSDSEKA